MFLPAPASRLKGLLDEAPANGTTRTAAQAEAARRNGAQSRGPVTEEGKSTSSQNALRHGLLAKHFHPKSDVRGYEYLYKLIHCELLEEFQPTKVTQRAAIARLASAYVQQARAARMIELKHTSGRLAGRSEVVRRKDETLRNLSTMQEAENKLAGGIAEPMSDKRAKRVAARVSGWIKLRLEEEAEMAAAVEDMEPATLVKDDSPTHGEKPAWQMAVEESEEHENREIREVLAVIGDSSDRLSDDAYLAAVLTRTRRPKRNDLKGILAVVRLELPWLKGQLRARREDVEKLTGQVEEEERRLAANPEALMLMHVYQRRIDTDIRRLRRDCES